MQRSWFSRKLVALLILPLALQSSSVFALNAAGDTLVQRNKILSYVIREQLSRNHYSPKAIDDSLSRAAFDLYLKQLDGQKRFLLKSDVDTLRAAFGTQIDDELNLGRLDLANTAAQVMRQRQEQVRTLVDELLAGPFDFQLKEGLETDPEKLAYCLSEQELRERWRKTLKLQILTRYLNLVEDEGNKAAEKGPIDPKLLEKARTKVQESLHDFFARMQQETEQDHYDQFFNAITRVFDPHTNYLPPTEKEDFDISMRGSLEGIGATLREEDGYIKVVAVIPGSAAWRQGQLFAEDIILAVAQGKAEPVDVTDTRLRDAVRLIRGKKGSEVRLTVKKPDGTKLVIPIVRDVVQIEETFVKSALLPASNGAPRLGYIKIPSFYRDFQGSMVGGKESRNATDDTRKELRKLAGQKIDGLILDLRNNGGGALTDAVSIAGLFFKTGPVVQVREGDGATQTLEDRDGAIDYDGPLVVLVNQFSASASEILAGALQDYGRAVIIGGEHTHGKGTVQAVVDLDRTFHFPNMERYKPLGAMRVTIQKFYRISGESTQYRGIVPDIVLPDRLQHLKSGEQYIDYSLPWDRVPAVSFARWNELGLNLPALKSASAKRVQAEKGFQEIAAEAKKAKQRSEQTVQSLQIDDLRRERAEARSLADQDQESPHGDIKPKNQDRTLSEEQRHQAWVKELGEDPYTREAMAVLLDLRSAAVAAAGAKAPTARTP
jgi:carboxyl-terminal processing protease